MTIAQHVRRLALPSLGLLSWTLFTGCSSQAPSTEPSAQASPAPGGPAAPRVASAADGTVDPGVRQTAARADASDTALSEVVEAVPPPTAPVPEPAAAAPVVVPAPAAAVEAASTDAPPALVPPVVEAAKEQVNSAVGELGQGVQQVTDGVKQGVRQTAEEVGAGVGAKVDGVKQNFRQAAGSLGQKARDTTHKVTSDLVNKARNSVDLGLKPAPAKDAAKVPPPAR